MLLSSLGFQMFGHAGKKNKLNTDYTQKYLCQSFFSMTHNNFQEITGGVISLICG